MSTTPSSSSSPRCVPFAFRRAERRARGLPASPPPPPPAAAGCGRPLCRAGELVGGGVRGAFFASLDGCSCVDVRTKSFNKEAEKQPLMMTPPLHAHHELDDAADDGARGAGRRSAGKTPHGSGGMRRGLGCCAANSTRVNY